MQKVDKITAENDYQRFVSTLKLHPLKVEDLEEEREKVISAIEYGLLTVDDDGRIVQYLDEPVMTNNGGGVEETVVLEKLEFRKSKVRIADLEKAIESKKKLTQMAEMITLLSRGNPSLIKKISTFDMAISQAVAQHFL